MLEETVKIMKPGDREEKEEADAIEKSLNEAEEKAKSFEQPEKESPAEAAKKWEALKKAVEKISERTEKLKWGMKFKSLD
jgi:uncharacterized FlaG/YvyC family protein